MMRTYLAICLWILALHNFAWGQCGYKTFTAAERNFARKVHVLATQDPNLFFTVWWGNIDTTMEPIQSNLIIWVNMTDSCGSILKTQSLAYDSFTLDIMYTALITRDTGILIVGMSEFVPQGGLGNLTLFKLDNQGKLEWKRAYTTPSRNDIIGRCIGYTVDSTGYIIGGEFTYRKNEDYNRGYLLLVDLQGNVLNEKQIIINNDTTSLNSDLMYVREVFALADSGYMALIQGGQNDSLYLAKFDKHLNMLWLKRPFLGKYDRLSTTFDATINQQKQTMVVFTLAQPMDSLSDGRSILWRLFEFDTSGVLIKQKPVLEDKRNEQIPFDNIHLLNDGGYIIGVNFTRLDSNWNIVATTKFDEWQFPQAYAERADGSLVCAGYQYMPELDRSLIFIQSLNSDGVPLPVQKKPVVVEPPTFSLYPNPATQSVTIANAPAGSLVTITDRLGRMVYQLKLDANNADIGHLQPGIYMVQVELNGKYWTPQKLMIAK